MAFPSALHRQFASGITPTDPCVYRSVAITVAYRTCTQPRIVGFVSRGGLVTESCEDKVATRSGENRCKKVTIVGEVILITQSPSRHGAFILQAIVKLEGFVRTPEYAWPVMFQNR
ncbi:MAG: hypothetical protein CBB71_17180 [Rhodopirellula sp. TMED11]|nr:MAG: hypothetical protein CBB71_17180 [Rhodopirellula sp. TMED11]